MYFSARKLKDVSREARNEEFAQSYTGPKGPNTSRIRATCSGCVVLELTETVCPSFPCRRTQKSPQTSPSK
jgi:hypothetical protein